MEKNKLTAYALNEISGTERAEIEAYLELHPDEKRDVEEIKAVSAILRSELAGELFVAAPEFKKALKTSIWSKLIKPKTLALTFSLGFVGVISLMVLKQNQAKLTMPELDSISRMTIPDMPAQNQMAPSKDSYPHAISESSGHSAQEKKSPVDSAVAARSKNRTFRFEYAPQISDGTTSGSMGAGAKSKRDFGYQQNVGAVHGGRAEGESQMADRREFYPGTPPPAEPVSNTEDYKFGSENDFILTAKESLSTFSIDVDTASYANARRYLNSYTQLPPVDSIRTEEFVNYFEYDYAPPSSGHPIAVHMEATRSPWNTERALVRVGLKGKELAAKDRPRSNLVFLIDVSGSMSDENKMPLVKSSMRALTEQLQADDRISMVVYAGQSGVVLDSEKGSNKDKILKAIQDLASGGSTNGEGGIRKAYDLAQKNFISGGNNRVILASDGDFNVGVTSPKELLDIIKAKSEGGVFLTVLGYGMGNYKDAQLEEISNKGQGNYFYIDTEKEAHKVLVNQLAGTLFTIAKDVKVQVEFNPKVVHSYRLVGYENRMLNKEDFANDKIDAGEMGAGHSVTALYEIEWKSKSTDPTLKYQPEVTEKNEGKFSDEILTAKIRYKKPTNSTSEYFDQVLKNKVSALSDASCSTRFATAVASFSQWMRQSPHLKGFEIGQINKMTENCLSTNDRKDSFKEEFLDLVKKAREIKK